MNLSVTSARRRRGPEELAGCSKRSEVRDGLILFDLDGTLALIDHRRHLVTGPRKKWREFFAASPQDRLNEPVAAAWRAYRDAGYHLWIVSARSDEVKPQTQRWLREHDLVPERLLMRRAGDHRPDIMLKEGWLRDGTIPRERVVCVYDDRSRVVAMWRDAGLACFQVAPGDF